ncbi:ribbon-helix-helix domain-containing protein [Geobacillus sp. E263]|uniref:ribbon-helix-helix domain-containing protein n=1 Tax=Geobacillus sp. E263 TaxID=391290 RepID=UPI00155EE285|nr:ribbon-helix-helix domain-containing protein [Geobacillus sp. E263]
MKTAGEIVCYLNETGANIYELSEELGLGRTTLRSRLLKLGYQVNQDGKWYYAGDPDKETKDVDIMSKKRMTIPKKAYTSPQVAVNVSTESNIHQALMQLDLTQKGVRTTITIQPEYLEGMKELSVRTRLRLSDLYALAIYEFLNKYHPGH